MHGRGVAGGACVAVGMHGRGCAGVCGSFCSQGGMRGGAWQGACMAGGHAWQGDV